MLELTGAVELVEGMTLGPVTLATGVTMNLAEEEVVRSIGVKCPVWVLVLVATTGSDWIKTHFISVPKGTVDPQGTDEM